MKKHFSIRVSGKVQGVFFRASTKQQADKMNISGFVRNDPDGTVEIEAEGDEQNMRQFIEWCQHGPSHAHVEKCQIKEGAVTGLVKFVVERS